MHELRRGHVFLRRCDHLHDLPCWNDVCCGRLELHDIKRLQGGDLHVGIDLRELHAGHVFRRRRCDRMHGLRIG